MNALDVAGSYITSVEPLLKASTGIQYAAVFLAPDPVVVRECPETFPLARAVYVLGLLERSHWACIATIARNHRWLVGAKASVDSANLLAFAASLRGFLEAAADSHDVLQYLPRALIDARDYLYASLHQPHSVEEELGMSDLEDRLIHFAFATKRAKSSGQPRNHVPKTNADYIREVEKFGVAGAASLYSELCELTHPAAPSVDCFLDSSPRFFELNFEKDAASITDILERYNDVVVSLAMYSFNPALVSIAFLARLAPGWPAPHDHGLQDIPLATKNLALFNELAKRIGPPSPIAQIQQAMTAMA